VRQQLTSKIEVADFICGVDIVDFADDALVKDGIEGISCIGGVQITTSVEAGAMNDQRARWIGGEKRTEFGNDLYFGVSAC
jgi:hypothetical protein